jgi:hypothetical protein
MVTVNPDRNITKRKILFTVKYMLLKDKGFRSKKD